MAVTVTCPACEQSLPLSEELLGKKIRCKACQETFVAAAAPAKVGGRGAGGNGPGGGPARNGTSNGQHSAAGAKRPAKAAPKSGGNAKVALIGGGVFAVVLAAGLGAWALMGKGDGAKPQAATPPTPAATASLPKIKLTETAPPADAPKAPAVAKTEPKAPPASDTAKSAAAPSRRAGMAAYAESPKALPPAMPPDVVNRIKKSAVQLRCMFPDGGGEGSGWFAEPGIVVTNAHVVGMKEAAMAPPTSIRVFINRGEVNERELSGKLLALDRENDLAVVQVKGNNLPEPLPICPSAELFEGQRIYIMGFPLGSRLARELSAGAEGHDTLGTLVKIRESSVASRMSYKAGGVKLIQVEGGADKGNSGGAVLDSAGNVRAILVAGIPGTNMRFVIPSEYAVNLLQGRVLSVVPGQAYRSGSVAKQPLIARIADPMKRIRKVALNFWAGDAGSGQRPASDRQPGSLPGDGPVSSAELNLEPNLILRAGDAYPATGECDLPEKRADQVYWMQPRYERTDGTTWWGEAVITNLCGLPIDQSPAELVIKHQSGSERWVDVHSKFATAFVPEGYPVSAIEGSAIDVALTEKTRGLEADGAARVRYVYNNFGFADKETNEALKEPLRDMFAAAKDMAIEATVTKKGLIRGPRADMASVPQDMRGRLTQFNYQIMQALEGMALLLPEKSVGPGETWQDETRYTFRFNKDQTEEATSRITFKYLGQRKRNGRDEGVVTFAGLTFKSDGSAAGTAGDGTPRSGDVIDEYSERRRGIFGVVAGAALVDLQTGYTTLVQSNSSIAIDLKVKLRDQEGKEVEVPITYGAAMETKLERRFAADAPRSSHDVYLPNVAVNLNPFVGAPDESATAGATAGNADDPSGAGAATGTQPLQLKKEVWDKVKAAGCLIQVMRDDGGGHGSGWLAEPGIVVTNAHVVGMVDPASRPPTSVEVFFNHAEPNERKFNAKILTVDYGQDLCVLELPTKEGLPEPLTIIPSTDTPNPLYDGQRMYAVGFPEGTRLGKEMAFDRMDKFTSTLKLRQTSMMGRQENKKTKLLKYIMVEGGLTSGNSGGAVIDTNGAVRAVAVAVVLDPVTGGRGQMGLCVPSEYAERLLRGYPLETRPRLAYKDGAVAKLPVEMKFGDPLKRVKKVFIDYWVGAPGMPRRGSATAPKPRPTDTPRQSAECTYDAEKAVATGEFVLPESEVGRAYWIQPRYVDGAGVERWGDAVFFAPDGPPVDRRDIDLTAKFKPGTQREVDVKTDAEYRYVYYGTDIGRTNHLYVKLNEFVGRFNPVAKGHEVGYQLEEMKFGRPRSFDEARKILAAAFAEPNFWAAVQSIRNLTVFTKDGVMTNIGQTDYSALTNPQGRELFSEFNTQVLQAVQTMSLRFPNKVVKYGESWEHPSNLMIGTRNRFEPALFTLTMTYKGVRERGGRSEAVIEVKGSVRENPNEKAKEHDLKTDPEVDKQNPNTDKDDADPATRRTAQTLPPSEVVGKKPLFGLVRGYAYIDTETGTVSYCRLFLDFDAEIKHKDKQTGTEVPVRAGGTMEMEMKRRI
jgi:S1-C subfamily serine protease